MLMHVYFLEHAKFNQYFTIGNLDQIASACHPLDDIKNEYSLKPFILANLDNRCTVLVDKVLMYIWVVEKQPD